MLVFDLCQYLHLLVSRSKRREGYDWAHAKYGFALKALIPSAPRSTKTQTLWIVLVAFSTVSSTLGIAFLFAPCAHDRCISPQKPTFDQKVGGGRESR